MKVESASYEAYLAAMEEWKQKMQQMQAAQTEENSETDSYVASISAEDMPMPTGTYDAQGMMVGGETSNATDGSSGAICGDGYRVRI